MPRSNICNITLRQRCRNSRSRRILRHHGLQRGRERYQRWIFLHGIPIRNICIGCSIHRIDGGDIAINDVYANDVN